jgi:hypothetical protein
VGDISDDDNYVSSEKRPTLSGPSADPPGRLSGNFSKHKLGITVGGAEEKNKYSVGQSKISFCAHKTV